MLDSHLWALCRKRKGLKVDNTIEEGHLSLMALLTQCPGTQNAFDPVLMVFGMLTENWRQELKKRECQKERIQSNTI